jgi:broad specificity phosphatase PhoE
MSKIFLIRHAESSANAGGRTTDPAKISLTGKGFEQAICLASAFKSQPDFIVTSPYLRTKQTARPLLERFNNIEEAEWMVQEFTYLSPAKCQNTTAQERRPLVNQYWERNDPFFSDGIGAESFADLLKRVEYFIEQVKLPEKKSIAVFSHGQFIRAIIWRFLSGNTDVSPLVMKQFRNFMTSFEIPNASTMKIQVEKDGSLWISSVDKSYLPQELLS